MPMNAIVERSISSLKRWKATDWLWRLSILSLPWQTRVFMEGMDLAGYPWEQGRFSLYLSMFLMVAYMLSFVVERRSLRPLNLRPLMIIGLLLLGIVTLLTMNRRATAMWLIQVVILIAFCAHLARDSLVRRETLVFWFCVSLIPHAFLGVWQFFRQSVFASTLLGMSAQLPETLGVSVIETNGERVLRAYGGFPHPNIFGGWLVFGLAGSLFLAFRSRKEQALIWMAITFMFTAALFFTFSRTAWLSAAALIAGSSVIWFMKSKERSQRKRLAAMLAGMLLFTLALGAWQSDLLMTRTQLTERLETKSFEERAVAIELAKEVISHDWLIGTGQGAYLYALVREGVWTGELAGPPIPPHNTFILLFAELGLLGSIGSVLLAGGILKQLTRRREWLHYRSFIFFVPLILLGLFDHYLWSFWSGQALLALVVTGWALTLDIYE